MNNCETCKHFSIESVYGVCDKTGILNNVIEHCDFFERDNMTDLNKINRKFSDAITYEKFLELNKTEDLCFEVADGKISDDIEDYFCELDYVVTAEDVKAAIISAKQVKIFNKERYKIPKGFIMGFVSDYLTDNFGYDSYEQDSLENIVGEEIFTEFETKLNKELSHLYTSYVGDYIMDISKEVEEYLKSELGEDYPLSESEVMHD